MPGVADVPDRTGSVRPCVIQVAWTAQSIAPRSDDTEALESGNRSRVELMVASIQTRVEPRGHCSAASVDHTEARFEVAFGPKTVESPLVLTNLLHC